MKIITVTLNPCIDVNYNTEKPFSPGKLYRVEEPAVSYNGKGINVSRTLRALGEESVCLTVYDGQGELEGALRKEGLTTYGVRSRGKLRHNIAVLDCEGSQTQINEPGMRLSDEEMREFCGIFKSELNCKDKCAAVICGSLPPGADSSFYRKLVSVAKGAGAYTVLDCDGEALKLGVEATPDLIKPNLSEFCKLTGTKIAGGGEELRIDAVRAALEFYRNEECAVLCTLGEDGSVYAGPEGSFMCQAVSCKVKNFKGAGDSFLAAFILEHIVREKDCDISMMLASREASRHMSGQN